MSKHIGAESTIITTPLSLTGTGFSVETPGSRSELM